MAPKLIRATSGADWRDVRHKGVPVQLPSLYVAYIRPVQPEKLVAQGEIIDILTPLVGKILFEGADATAETIAKVIGDVTEPVADDPTRLREAMAGLENLERVCDIVCRAAFVNPRIVDDPQGDDEIGIDDIDLPDKIHVLTLSLRGAAALKHFRYQPPADVEPVPDREGDAQPTEQPSDDQRLLGGVAVR